MNCKRLGTIFNNDIDNIICALRPNPGNAGEYRRIMHNLLDLKPGVLAQNVGYPEGTLYPSKVATPFWKYLGDVCARLSAAGSVPQDALTDVAVCRAILEAGTDPLQLAIDACRERGTPIIASYRMNGEDYYQQTYLLSDFGRAHPEYRIRYTDEEKVKMGDPAMEYTGALDYAFPEVYDHVLAMFTEVVNEYELDGLELDFRRWFHMISKPLENHRILTQLVRDTRKMLDDTARRKGRDRLLLTARVAPSLDRVPNVFLYTCDRQPVEPINAGCLKLGLDVPTWIEEGLVDCICPSTWGNVLESLPMTGDFARLTAGTGVGLYPTLFTMPAWMQGVCNRRITLAGEDERARALYKYDLCTAALRLYGEGADGISTFNWFPHLRNTDVELREEAERVRDDSRPYIEGMEGLGAAAIQTHVYPRLGDPRAISDYLLQPWAVPPVQ